jgi:hypothetical protein
MATIRYSFRPSLFQAERTIVIDEGGIVVREEPGHDRRIGWAEIDEVHLEPGTAGDDDKTRWLLNLGVRRWVVVAWQIALPLTLAAGLFGAAAAVVVEEYEALMGAGVFIAFGIVGLLALKGKGGPKTYDPKDFVKAREK